jgi:Ca2+-binding EF-hand superfamily protein
MRTCAETIDSMFDRLDRDHSGTLSIDELRELMREVSQGAPLGEDDVSFVMQHAQRGSDDTGTIARTEIQHAISLWRYLLHERKFIVDRFDEFDHDKNGRLDRGELKALMTSLNDGIECTDKEVTWVIKLGTSAYAGGSTGKASLDADEVRGALAMWYPALRKRRQLEELPIALRGATGKTRRAVSAQLSRYRVEVDTLMQQEGCVDGTMGRSTLHRLLNQLNGAPVSDAAVDYVLALSDADHSDIIEPREVATAVATWCTLRQQQDLIDASFDEFDVDHSGKLSREQVRTMLQQLNDGLPVTWTEVDWTIESADANGDGSLDRQELRAAVACWYLHVSSRVIVPLSGWRAMVPWVLCSCVGLVCAMLVASISVKWSVVDTKAWLGTTLLSLVWKLVVFDPIKTLCCGSLLDPFYALICGEFEADALLESVEDVVETYTEEFTGAQVGGQAVDDVSRATQAATIAAGNNAIFAMGGLGAGKFHRKVALNRGKRGFKIEMQQHDQDAAAVDRRLGLQHTLSHSRYAEKINAKRQAAGFSTAEFSNRSMRSVISAHQTQMEQVDESEHTQLAALMVASAKREQLSVDESVAAQATAARRRYAGRVANKRRARGLTIGGFARSSGVQVDPLVDIMAVSKFVDAHTKPASPSSSTQKETAKDLEAQSAEATEFAFGEMASGRLDLSASMITRQRPREVAAEVAVSPATDYDPAAAAGKEYDWLDGVALSGGVSDEEIETVELVPPDSAGARGGQQGQEGRSRRAGKRRN